MVHACSYRNRELNRQLGLLRHHQVSVNLSPIAGWLQFVSVLFRYQQLSFRSPFVSLLHLTLSLKIPPSFSIVFNELLNYTKHTNKRKVEKRRVLMISEYLSCSIYPYRLHSQYNA